MRIFSVGDRVISPGGTVVEVIGVKSGHVRVAFPDNEEWEYRAEVLRPAPAPDEDTTVPIKLTAPAGRDFLDQLIAELEAALRTANKAAGDAQDDDPIINKHRYMCIDHLMGALDRARQWKRRG